MTIDEAVERIKDHIDVHQYESRAIHISEALNMAVDIMRKYQIMQEVLEKTWKTPACMMDYSESLNKIMETYRNLRS